VIARTVLVTFTIALVLAAAAAAAPPNLKGLVLRLSDFPAGTRTDPASQVNGPIASSITLNYQIHPGDLNHEEDVSIQIWWATSVAGAESIYQQTLATYTGKGPQLAPFAASFKGESVLSLPRYGDEQFADYLPHPERPHGQLIVRKGKLVWYLTVENCTIYSSCYGTSRTEQPIGKTLATAELKKYGAKQKARVGAG
jgi:hypothetical protein